MNVKIERSVGVGIVFGLMFWLVLDSIVLGVMLGVLFGVAVRVEEWGNGKKKVGQ